MTKVIRFFATCVLAVSMAAVALAGGGEIHGPNLAPPQPATTECTSDCADNGATCSGPEPSLDAFDVVNALVTWLVQLAP